MIKAKQVRYLKSNNSKNLKHEKLNNIVISVDWEYSLEGFQTISGTLSLNEPSIEKFVPIEELTHDIVLNWLGQYLNLDFDLLPIVSSTDLEEEILTLTFE